jgi:hypothetical protein
LDRELRSRRIQRILARDFHEQNNGKVAVIQNTILMVLRVQDPNSYLPAIGTRQDMTGDIAHRTVAELFESLKTLFKL